eukprot:Hpha_TRINITY_DN13520_c2_g1::TRINITY_DN13520_c2_g1_i1::g.111461::m.111461
MLSVVVVFGIAVLPPQQTPLTTFPPQRDLRIIATPCPPFTYSLEETYTTERPIGFSEEMWHAVFGFVKSNATGWTHAYNWHWLDYPELWGNISADEAASLFDVVISCITMTPEREQDFDFSHPFFDTGYGILLPDHTPPASVSWTALVMNFLRLGSIIAGLALTFAHVLWAAETRFDRGTYWISIWDGVWFGVVTMTTVGYGDKYPRTSAGRVVTTFYLVLAVLSFSYFTALLSADITSTVLETNIKDLGDLRGKRVGVQAATASVAEMKERGMKVVEIKGDGIKLLEAIETQQVEAVVADHPMLSWFVSENPERDVHLLPGAFLPFSFALLFPRGSILRDRINSALLEWRKESHLDMMNKYFSSPAGDTTIPTDLSGFDTFSIISAITCAVFLGAGLIYRFFAIARRRTIMREKLLNTPIEELYTVGMRVTHPQRGDGEVAGFRKTSNETRVVIEYDCGETHAYASKSLFKIPPAPKEPPPQPALASHPIVTTRTRSRSFLEASMSGSVSYRAPPFKSVVPRATNIHVELGNLAMAAGHILQLAGVMSTGPPSGRTENETAQEVGSLVEDLKRVTHRLQLLSDVDQPPLSKCPSMLPRESSAPVGGMGEARPSLVLRSKSTTFAGASRILRPGPARAGSQFQAGPPTPPLPAPVTPLQAPLVLMDGGAL